MKTRRSNSFLRRRMRAACTLVGVGFTMGGCSQAHAPREGTTRTEDVSQVVYNHAWLKEHVLLRSLRADRLEGNLLQVTAQLHSTEAHTSRKVRVRTEFYSPPMSEGGTMVDGTEWQHFVLEPRKRVQYQVKSLVPADDFCIYVYYGEDIGRP